MIPTIAQVKAAFESAGLPIPPDSIAARYARWARLPGSRGRTVPEQVRAWAAVLESHGETIASAQLARIADEIERNPPPRRKPGNPRMSEPGYQQRIHNRGREAAGGTS